MTKDLEQLLIRINLLSDEEINEDARWDIIDTLNNHLEQLRIGGVSGSFSEDDCQQLMFYGKTKNNQVKLDDGSKHLDYFLLKAFAYMKDNTIFDTENAIKMFWNRIKALANYR